MSAVFPTIPNANISQEFNNFNPQYYGGDGKHKGIDFGIPSGTPVFACLNGLVETATVIKSGYGRHVIIKHGDGSRSIYGHLSSYSVTVGQPVEAGQRIGMSGGDPSDNGAGNSTGAHLHWEIRPAGAKSDQDAIDPYAWCLMYLPKGIKAKCISSIGLNVRVSASTDAKILYTLKQGQEVEIASQAGGWAQLRALRPEFCAVEYLEVDLGISDAEKLARLWRAHPELQ